MGNKGDKCTYNEVPPDESLADFDQIKTNQDAIKWLKTNFTMNKVMMEVKEDLEDFNFTLYDCSYKYSDKCNAVVITFRMSHRITHSDNITSFQYYPSIKS